MTRTTPKSSVRTRRNKIKATLSRVKVWRKRTTKNKCKNVTLSNTKTIADLVLWMKCNPFRIFQIVTTLIGLYHSYRSKKTINKQTEQIKDNGKKTRDEIIKEIIKEITKQNNGSEKEQKLRQMTLNSTMTAQTVKFNNITNEQTLLLVKILAQLKDKSVEEVNSVLKKMAEEFSRQEQG